MNVDRNPSTTSPAGARTTFAAVLGLPARSSLSLDGQTILLHRDDFVGIGGIPIISNDKDGDADDFCFHLLTIRSCVRTKESSQEPVFASVTTGFVLPNNNNDDDGPLMRRYDPQTEEVAAEPLDETTRHNLLQAIQQTQQQQQQQPRPTATMDPRRLIPYAGVMRSQAAVTSWRQATSFISIDLLRRRGIPPGTKIVPGTAPPGEKEEVSNVIVAADNDDDTRLQQQQQQRQVDDDDGRSPLYPNIPVLGDGSDRLDGGRARRASSTQHRGTKAFLRALSPTRRTQLLLMEKDPCTTSFLLVLDTVYRGNDHMFLGDVQLSFCLFVHLHCHASWEHWRDAVAHACRVSDAAVVYERADFFCALVDMLSRQVLWRANVPEEEAGGFGGGGGDLVLLDDDDDNFLIPSLRRLWHTLESCRGYAKLRQAARDLAQRLSNRWPQHFGASTVVANDDIQAMKPDGMVIDNDGDDDDRDDDDSDGPAVVAWEEVEASLQRQQQEETRNSTTNRVVTYTAELTARFPILFAARQPHEDIVMTCARALDAKTDVSLVREAADYLEQVEAARRNASS